MDDELKQAFDLFDRNGDGTVSKAELVCPYLYWYFNFNANKLVCTEAVFLVNLGISSFPDRHEV